ncbi:MAG TPA: hypothetical protein VHY79_14745 [Rhizomicrobium sp.]|jgi:hypothetical protein|nr:hypothetical protein [Rhizomicrobium sp.]
MTDMHAKTYGEIRADQPIRGPIGRRRKTLRHHFCDGIDAAVKAEPDAFANTRPRTMLGLMVHSLVRGAATGRCDQVKLVVFFLDEAERRRGVVEHIVAPDGDSQGNLEPKSALQPQWDWSEDGAWDSTMRTDDPKVREEAEQEEARAEALREEIGDRFHRALEAERINTERRVRMELEREGRSAVPETAAAPFSGNNSPAAAFSGNIPPAAARDPHAGTVRIGGRIVDV